MARAGVKRSVRAKVAPMRRLHQQIAISPTVWNMGASHSSTESTFTSAQTAKFRA